MIVFGTRPEVIKLAPVIRELRRRKNLITRICFTAQHREICNPLMRFFSIEPHHDLDVMTENQSLSEIATRTIARLDRVLDSDPSDMIVVQGDTTSAFAASLLAFYRRIPVAHVEAGLRTGDIYYPYPEEMNRRLISRVANLNFAPTERARKALVKEAIPEESIWVTGNTVIDALHIATNAVRRSKRKVPQAASRRLILVTAHRRESFGRGIEEICLALAELHDRNPHIEIFFPVHPNPAVRKIAYRLLSGKERIVLSQPVDYLELVKIMDDCYLVLTDSGGLQEEAPALGKPVVVMRDETERPEIVEAGGAVLAGPHRKRIVETVERIISDRKVYARMARVRNPFGDGRAAVRIAKIIEAWFEKKGRVPNGLRRSIEFGCKS